MVSEIFSKGKSLQIKKNEFTESESLQIKKEMVKVKAYKL